MMKRLLIVSGMMSLLVACGDSSTVEDEAAGAPELNVTNFALYTCSGDCPAGYAITGYGCISGVCNLERCTDQNIRNRTICTDIPDGNDMPDDGEPDTGPRDYIACDTTLNPTPYHYTSRREINSGCTSNVYTWDSTQYNRTYYNVYPGPNSSYTTCGMDSCRSGDYALGYSYASSCRLSTSESTAKNRTACMQVVNSSTDLCGIIACPSSAHYVSAYSYISSCNKVDDGSTERNRTTCLYPSSTTTVLYACGSSCPDGFVAQSSTYSSNCRPSNSSPTSGNNRVTCVRSGG